MSTPPDFAKLMNAEELAELALQLANTFSPAGHEQAMADAVLGWFEQQKIPARQQPPGARTKQCRSDPGDPADGHRRGSLLLRRHRRPLEWNPRKQ